MELDASSSLSQGVVLGSSSSTVAIDARQFAARLLTAPAIAFAHYIRRKPPPHKNFFSGNTNVHPNLHQLCGICATPEGRILVYPYMSNGNVASALTLRPERSDIQPPLDWSKRKPIAVGSARGLAYLHDQCDLEIIHRDIKPENYLLDEDFEAVFDVFRLAICMDHNDTLVTTYNVLGTLSYVAPEYYSTRIITERIDVYGYGVMLIELITGQSAPFPTCFASGKYIMSLNWVKQIMEKKLETLVDPNLQGNYIDEEVEQLIKVAILCSQDSPSKRPKMSEVVRMLEGDELAERWEEWQNEEMLEGDDDQPDSDWIISDSVIEQEEFSEPR